MNAMRLKCHGAPSDVVERTVSATTNAMCRLGIRLAGLVMTAFMFACSSEGPAGPAATATETASTSERPIRAVAPPPPRRMSTGPARSTAAQVSEPPAEVRNSRVAGQDVVPLSQRIARERSESKNDRVRERPVANPASATPQSSSPATAAPRAAAAGDARARPERRSDRTPAMAIDRPVTMAQAAEHLSREIARQLDRRSDDTPPVLAIPAATECVPLALMKDVSSQLRKYLGPRLAPHGEMLKAYLKKQGELQLLDYKPAARKRLDTPNVAIVLDWQPRAGGDWSVGRVRVDIVDRQKARAVSERGIGGDGTLDLLVKSGAPCRLRDGYGAVVATAPCNPDLEPELRRQNAIDAAEYKAMALVARQVSSMEKRCSAVRGEFGLPQEHCTVWIRSVGALRGYRADETYDAARCTARVVWRHRWPGDFIDRELLWSQHFGKERR